MVGSTPNVHWFQSEKAETINWNCLLREPPATTNGAAAAAADDDDDKLVKKKRG